VLIKKECFFLEGVRQFQKGQLTIKTGLHSHDTAKNLNRFMDNSHTQIGLRGHSMCCLYTLRMCCSDYCVLELGHKMKFNIQITTFSKHKYYFNECKICTAVCKDYTL